MRIIDVKTTKLTILNANYVVRRTLRDSKYWPPVARVDNVWGDRNVMYSCVGMEAYGKTVTADKANPHLNPSASRPTLPPGTIHRYIRA